MTDLRKPTATQWNRAMELLGCPVTAEGGTSMDPTLFAFFDWVEQMYGDIPTESTDGDGV